MMSVNQDGPSIDRWPRWVRVVIWSLFVAFLGVIAILYMLYSEDFLLRVMTPWLDRLGCYLQDADGRRGSCAGLATRLTAVTGFLVLVAYGRRLFLRVATVLGFHDRPNVLGSFQGAMPLGADAPVASKISLPWSQVRLSGDLGVVDDGQSLFRVGEYVIYCWSRLDVPRLAAEVDNRIDAVCQRLPNGEYVLCAYRVGEQPTVRVVGVVLMGVSFLIMVGGMLLSWLLGQRALMLGFGAFLLFDLVCVGFSHAAYRVLASRRSD